MATRLNRSLVVAAWRGTVVIFGVAQVVAQVVRRDIVPRVEEEAGNLGCLLMQTTQL